MHSSPLWCGCGGNGFIHPVWCGRGCYGVAVVDSGFIHPRGVAVVLVMVVVIFVRLQGHVEVLGARLTST